jgi:hypothetical protein
MTEPPRPILFNLPDLLSGRVVFAVRPGRF